jgi:hypothetical protein
MWEDVKQHTKHVPIIYISATPYAQGYQLLYHQLALSSYSPYGKWATSFQWFKEFGIPTSVYIQGVPKPVYTKVRADCFDLVKHLFVTMTRKDAGFEFEPEDRLHWIALDTETKKLYNVLRNDRVCIVKGKQLVADTISKLRYSLHMLEGGVAIIDEEYLVLDNSEKIQYIMDTWGDAKDLVIMYNYIAEGIKLHNAFTKATVLQATSYAEGIDLYQYKNLVIYSQDFSTARHVQRRARQANMNRAEPIEVHFLLVKKGISEEVYNTVAINKQNYVDKLFKGETL